MACGGGCCMDIYRLAPHPNMTMDRSSGTTIQNVSSLIEPPMGAPISLGARRRYLMEKAIMRTRTKRLMNSDTTSRKKNSASTRPAIGRRAPGIRAIRLAQSIHPDGSRKRGVLLPPAEKKNGNHKAEDGKNAAETH